MAATPRITLFLICKTPVFRKSGLNRGSDAGILCAEGRRSQRNSGRFVRRLAPVTKTNAAPDEGGAASVPEVQRQKNTMAVAALWGLRPRPGAAPSRRRGT